jgi:1,4-alpha-glucan branching enzyme
MSKTPKKLKNPSSPAESAKSEAPRIVAVKPAAIKAESQKLMPVTTTTVPVAKSAQPKANRVCLELLKPEAKAVCVAGSFNGWKPESTPLTRTGNGRWVGDLSVQPGRYEYLFVVDGQWMPDPNAKEAVANPFGGTNSVLIAAD